MAKLVSYLVAAAASLSIAQGAGAADTAPDALVKSVVEDVLVVIKDNKDPQTLRTLGMQPDLDVKTQIITRQVPVEDESF